MTRKHRLTYRTLAGIYLVLFSLALAVNSVWADIFEAIPRLAITLVLGNLIAVDLILYMLLYMRWEKR